MAIPAPPPISTDRQIHHAEREALGAGDTEPLAALCLSGGGVRSAAFCLGAVQALARQGQPPDAPISLHAFKAKNTSFPHEGSFNQFFTESEFESYRSLGDYVVSTALTRAKTASRAGQAYTLSDVFTELRHCANAARTPGPKGPADRTPSPEGL